MAQNVQGSRLISELMIRNQKKNDTTLKEPIYHLSLKKICFSWPCGTKALDNCSLDIPHPGLWMLIGRNGSGKSTLFRLISGMIQPQKGKFSCSYQPALMFQNPDHQLLLPTCSSDLILSAPKDQTKKQLNEKINLALDQVGLRGMASRPIHTLSGGQKQRLALAGALISNANLLLLDEPTALLDISSQKSILEIVKTLASRPVNPITALWVTHRIEELQYCHGAAEMSNGSLGKWHSGHELMHRLI